MKFTGGLDTDKQLDFLLNGGLSLFDNFSGATIETKVVIGENEVLHGLGRIPNGYLVLYMEKSQPFDVPGGPTNELKGIVNDLTKTINELLIIGMLVKPVRPEIYGSRITEWTKEKLYFQSSVKSARVRLFVL